MKQRFNVFCQCMTPTAVTFLLPIVIEGIDENEAMNATVDHLLKHGGSVTLMPGGPALPVAIVAAIVVRIDLMSSIVQASHLPKTGVN